MNIATCEITTEKYWNEEPSVILQCECNLFVCVGLCVVVRLCLALIWTTPTSLLSTFFIGSTSALFCLWLVLDDSIFGLSWSWWLIFLAIFLNQRDIGFLSKQELRISINHEFLWLLEKGISCRNVFSFFLNT